MKEIKTTLRRTRKRRVFAVSIAHWEITLVNSIVKGSFTGLNKALVNTLTQRGYGTQPFFKAPGDLRVE